jgi:hypothetical protein
MRKSHLNEIQNLISCLMENPLYYNGEIFLVELKKIIE